MDKSVWLRYDKVDRGMWLVLRSQTAFMGKAVWIRKTSTWLRCCASAEVNENVQLQPCICCWFQESASVQLQRSRCYQHAQASSASFQEAPLMSQNTHLSLRPIQTIYLCQSMTGTCLIKISDVLTLCRSNFNILSGALEIRH